MTIGISKNLDFQRILVHRSLTYEGSIVFDLFLKLSSISESLNLGKY